MPIKFDVLNRWSGEVQFTAEIDCAEDAPLKVKMGLAVRWAYKSGADLRGADLRGADLRGADLRGVPVVPNIDAAILAEIEAGGTLEMGGWHGACGTTHCRGGWAVHLAGAAGAALESAMGTAAAAALIYAASRPGVPVPYFYDTNEGALADIRNHAKAEGR